VRTQLVDGLLVDLLQDVRFLRVYLKYTSKTSAFRAKALYRKVSVYYRPLKLIEQSSVVKKVSSVYFDITNTDYYLFQAIVISN
jgi:hypothetical protein